jgi:hypothetical protein
MQHREARGSGEPTRGQRQLRGVSGDNLDRPPGQPLPQLSGQAVVDLHRGHLWSQLQQQVRDQAGAGPDFENVVPEVAVTAAARPGPGPPIRRSRTAAGARGSFSLSC